MGDVLGRGEGERGGLTLRTRRALAGRCDMGDGWRNKPRGREDTREWAKDRGRRVRRGEGGPATSFVMPEDVFWLAFSLSSRKWIRLQYYGVFSISSLRRKRSWIFFLDILFGKRFRYLLSDIRLELEIPVLSVKYLALSPCARDLVRTLRIACPHFNYYYPQRSAYPITSGIYGNL